MRRHPVGRPRASVLCAALLAATGCGSSSQESGDSQPLSVVALSRHGIRSPTASIESLNRYTTRPQGFARWPAPADVPGNLSSAGLQNAVRLGAWYRDFYTAQGLLPARGTCPATGAVFVYADLFERTLQAAQGYLDGLFQSETTRACGIEVSHATGRLDPYIITAAAGVCRIDTVADRAAFDAKAGSAASLIDTYAAELRMLQTVTQCPLLDLLTTVSTSGFVAYAGGTLFDVADTLTATFQLEYAQGMPDKDAPRPRARRAWAGAPSRQGACPR